MDKDAKILVTGAHGLVGSAVVRQLKARGYQDILAPTRHEINWEDPVATTWYFSAQEPDHVIFCSARVGGIADNQNNPIEFLLRNLHMEMNVLESAHHYGVEKFLFVGTSCMYPKGCPQPMKEEYIWTGPLEPATEAYSVAKLTGAKMCQYFGKNYVVALPCNVFGPGDRYDATNSHCLPGMMLRMHEAKRRGDKTFEIWGDGRQQREFIYSDDLADALIQVMERYEGNGLINVGSDDEYSLGELAHYLRGVMQYDCELVFNEDRPVGATRKLLDSSKLRSLGWKPQTPFHKGLLVTYADFLERFPA